MTWSAISLMTGEVACHPSGLFPCSAPEPCTRKSLWGAPHIPTGPPWHGPCKFVQVGEGLDERQVQIMSVLDSEPGPYTIIVGVDFSEMGNLALERPLELAAARRPAHLHVVFVKTAWTLRSQPPNPVAGSPGTRARTTNEARS